MNIDFIRWLSRHGKVKYAKKRINKNYKIICRKVKCAAKEGLFHTYYRNPIYTENIERLKDEGFIVELEGKGQSWQRWRIEW